MKRSLLFIALLVFTLGTLGSGCGKNPAGPSAQSPTATPTDTVVVATPTVTSTPTATLTPHTVIYSGFVSNSTSSAPVSYMDDGVWEMFTLPVGGGSWAVTLNYPWSQTDVTIGFKISYSGGTSTSSEYHVYVDGISKLNAFSVTGGDVLVWGPGTCAF